MINTKKYYFLPFADNLTAIGITFLIFLIFGSWMSISFVTVIAAFFMLFTLCGRIYVRMWKLSHKNTQRHYGLDAKAFIKFLLPLLIFDLLLILIYCLNLWGILPLDEMITKSYYQFPDNAPRELVNVTVYDYFSLVIRLWFLYLACFPFNALVLLVAPLLSFASGIFGYFMGAKNKEISNSFIKLTEKAKNKFNE